MTKSTIAAALCVAAAASVAAEPFGGVETKGTAIVRSAKGISPLGSPQRAWISQPRSRRARR